MLWTEERVDLLKKGWADGLSANQIAGRLGGVTRNAVIGKVHRLGLSGRSTVSRSYNNKQSIGAESRKRRARRGHVLHDDLLAQRAAMRALAVERQTNQAGPDLDIPPTERRRILVRDQHGKLCANDALDAAACRWPLGDPQHPDFGFCSHAAHPGLPYCVFHARRAYSTVEPLSRDPVLRDMDRARRESKAKTKNAKMHLGLSEPFRLNLEELV